LADGGADSDEVGAVGWGGWRIGALEISDVEDVGSAALRGALETRAERELALSKRSWSCHGDCGTGEESDGSEELHVDGCCLVETVSLVCVVVC